MKMNLKKIILFTMSACPMGRTMKHVLEEVTKRDSSLEFLIVYIDIEPETTNKYSIQSNPTTLFLAEDDKETGRIIGFKEVDEVLQVIDGAVETVVEWNYHQLEHTKEKQVENYTIYLYKGDRLESVDVDYQNPTSVKTPRITALNLLLKRNVAGYTTPFLPNTELNLVEFSEGLARVYLHMDDLDKEKQNAEKMKNSILKTLSPFGINEVEVIINFQ